MSRFSERDELDYKDILAGQERRMRRDSGHSQSGLPPPDSKILRKGDSYLELDEE